MANPLDRLINQLNTSPTAKSDSALWQVIIQLIRTLKDLQNEVNNSSGGGISTTNNYITQLTQQILDLDGGGGAGEDGQPGVPGPQGIPGTSGGGGVPYYIAPGDTFEIPEFIQSLFAMNIDNEGIIECDGFLIEVD